MTHSCHTTTTLFAHRPTKRSNASRRTVVWLKYSAEAVIALHHASDLEWGRARIETSAEACRELNASVEAQSQRFEGWNVSQATRDRLIVRFSLRQAQQPPFDYAFCLRYREGRPMLDRVRGKRVLECSACEAADASGMFNSTLAARRAHTQCKAAQKRITCVKRGSCTAPVGTTRASTGG